MGAEDEDAGYLEDQYTYTAAEVARLLGYEEGPGDADERDRTILDYISWAHDPGGDLTFYLIAVANETAKTSWMARRGPLAPHSGDAAVLWDFMMAIARLPAFQRAVVLCDLGGMTQEEIAEVLHTRQSTVSRILHGRPKRDSQGQEVRDEDGLTVYVGGINYLIARKMNGGP